MGVLCWSSQKSALTRPDVHFGPKQTSASALPMSAFDPKRTLDAPLLWHPNLLGFELNWRRPKPRGDGTCAGEISLKVLPARQRLGQLRRAPSLSRSGASASSWDSRKMTPKQTRA